MELLKKIILTLIVIAFAGRIDYAQEFTKKMEAFQKSYTEEAKKEYPAAINSLKSVYDEKS